MHKKRRGEEEGKGEDRALVLKYCRGGLRR
jgi:hypothetical protein